MTAYSILDPPALCPIRDQLCNDRNHVSLTDLRLPDYTEVILVQNVTVYKC